MIEILRNRRSVRKYEAKKIEAEKIEILKETLVRSPTSRNLNPWEFILVDDKELLQKLSRAKEHGSAFLENTALGIVVCGDSEKSDVWIEDCSIASILVQLTAQTLGLGSCWIQIRNRQHSEEMTSGKYVQKILNLPPQLKVESIISIGYAAEKKEPVPEKNLQFDKIKINKY